MNHDMQNTVNAVAEVLANVERHANSRKRFGVGRGIGLGLVTAGAVGAAYLLWRRSRPIEDPWAEEYWAKLTSSMDVPEVPVETAENESEGVRGAGAGVCSDTSGERGYTSAGDTGAEVEDASRA